MNKNLTLLLDGTRIKRESMCRLGSDAPIVRPVAPPAKVPVA